MLHDKVYIKEAKTCDFCEAVGLNTVAYADARVPGAGWANVCASHFALHGCTLGLGCGQELIVGEKPITERDSVIAMAADALGCSEDEIDW